MWFWLSIPRTERELDHFATFFMTFMASLFLGSLIGRVLFALTHL
jgi:hypothetical protein